MPRMFDILRGRYNNPEARTKGAVRKNLANLNISFRQQNHNIFSAQNDSENILQVSKKLIDAVKKKDVDSPEAAKEKYDSAVKVTEVLLEKANKGESFDSYIAEIYKTVDSLINQLILGNSLLEYIAEEYPKDNYLSRHITNVCILSLATGMQDNLNKSKLHSLGLAALFYDIGLLRFKKIIEQPKELSYDELKEIKNHTTKGAEAVFRIKSPHQDVVKKTIEQHHERVNGKGYPLGLKGDEINDFAKIIGLVDTYEAMIHVRPYRGAKMSHRAMREILGPSKLFFEPRIIKAFVDKLSVYPVGSFVRLNSGDIAKVISSNSVSPLRPIVLVIIDSYSRRISIPKALDLSKSDSVYINEPVLLDKN